MKAVILTAGCGKRMLPLTKYIPKALLPIGLTPAIVKIINEAVDSGVNEICCVVSDNHILKDFLSEYTSEYFKDLTLTFALQQNPLGSGDALLCAEEFCKKERFLLANCDEIFENNSFSQLLQKGELTIGCKKVLAKECHKYGILTCQQNKILKIEEKPTNLSQKSSPLASVGRYLLDGRIFDAIKQTNFIGGERRLTDALNILFCKAVVTPTLIDGKRFDIGSPDGYKNAFKYLG
ncbi:MAG: NTP transferase domain-containing protein [Clostridia bacterium]|nr:NTP transferase domain-containing protein [Clostridia bacterium]